MTDRAVLGAVYDYDTLADDLAALIEQFDLRDVTLVSHSMPAGEVVRSERRGQKRLRPDSRRVEQGFPKVAGRQCRALFGAGNLTRNDSVGN